MSTTPKSIQTTSIISGLPSGYTSLSFSDLKILQVNAEAVLNQLDANDDDNQYILLLNIPKAVRIQLDEDKNVLNGVGFRFTFEGNVSFLHPQCHYRTPIILNRSTVYQNKRP